MLFPLSYFHSYLNPSVACKALLCADTSIREASNKNTFHPKEVLEMNGGMQ